MNKLNKITLAIAIASIPMLSQAELKPMADNDMGAVTGQAGVTIELETQVNIGQAIYTDEGSLAVSDIFIGGANRDDLFSELGFAIPNTASDLLDNIKIDIDIAADGDAIIQILPLFGSPVDFAIRTGAWTLQSATAGGDSTVVMDNLNIEGIFGSFKVQVDTSTDKLNIDTLFAIDKMDLDVPFLALGIRNMRITGASFDDNPNVVTAFTHAVLDVYKAPNAAGNDSLAIDLQQFDADVNIGGLLVGGTSIGSISLNNLSIQNTQMRIYGH